MKTLELTKATASLATYARRIKRGPMILTAHGKPVAALVLINEADLETMQVSTDPRFLTLIRRSRAQFKRGKGIAPMELRRRLGVLPKVRQNGGKTHAA